MPIQSGLDGLGSGTVDFHGQLSDAILVRRYGVAVESVNGPSGELKDAISADKYRMPSEFSRSGRQVVVARQNALDSPLARSLPVTAYALQELTDGLRDPPLDRCNAVVNCNC